MSEAVSALAGAVFEGRVRVEDAGLQGMIALRIDTKDDAAAASLRAAGYEMPKPGDARGGRSDGAFWMSPDEVLLLCDYAAVEEVLGHVATHIKDHHALVTDVSDARCVVKLTGEAAALRETLAKLTPADMRPKTLKVGKLRRTRLAQVPAAIWFEDENTAYVVAFRSVADYVFGLLSNAAGGDAVGHF
ncbi:MAG: sarcosine oxidase subunit gamma family protein [Paracoccaceae bacterium]